MELRRHTFLPAQKDLQRCPRCFLNFSEGPSKYEVKPANLSNFAKKVMNKASNGMVLTDFQKKYYKMLKNKYPVTHHNKNQNKLVKTVYSFRGFVGFLIHIFFRLLRVVFVKKNQYYGCPS
mgnify:CR=1 FL=1